MSYARWSQGDVYVYASTMGGIVCMMCKFMPTRRTKVGMFGLGTGEQEFHEDFVCDTQDKMLEHLYKHKKSGDVVPSGAFERLKNEEDERKSQ